MNRWKLATVILLLLAVSLAFGFVSAYLHSRETDKALDAYIRGEAKAKGFGEGKFVEPKIPDAPAGSKKLFHAEGSNYYAPTRGASRPSISTPATEVALTTEHGEQLVEVETQSSPAACTLDDVGIRIRCVLDGIASPKRPFGRVYTSGTLEGFGEVRELPPMPALDVELEVAPWLSPATWHADVLIGIAAGDRIGYEVGTSWTGRSRVGPYILAEYQPAEAGQLTYQTSTEGYVTVGELPATWRVHAGIRIRIR